MDINQRATTSKYSFTEVSEGPVERGLAENVLLQSAHEANNLGRDPYLNELAKRYAGRYGNTVNHVINTIEALRSGNFDARILEVENNILTSVIEKLTADAQGHYNYDAEWQRNSAGQGQMVFGNRPALEVYQNAISDENGQIPLFEKARNMANWSNLRAMEAMKNAGARGLFVELSPSPDLSNDAIDRGYDGRDSIFVYDLSDNQRIPVEQYWFKRTELGDYNGMLDELRGNNDTVIGPAKDMVLNEELARMFPDAVIMHNYIYVPNKEALEPVLKFIKSRQNKSSKEAMGVIAKETPSLKSRIRDLLPGLTMAAREAFEDPGFDLTFLLSDLAAFVHDEQFALKLKLLQQTDFNTFKGTVRELLASGGDLDMARLLYSADGCGFKISKAGLFTASGISLNSGVPKAIRNMDTPRTSKVFDAKDPVDCPDCGRTFYVNNDDPSTWYGKDDGGCPFCHSLAICC